MTSNSVARPAMSDAGRVDFEATVRPEAQRLFRLAMTILGDPGLAEDAVQETMLAAWRKWPSLREAGSRSAWLTRICVNQCIRERRRGLRRTEWLFDDGREHARDGATDPQGASLLDFANAFALLTSRQRAAFALHVQHGYTVNEAAELMGCRPGTARSHLGRAVATLRREMGNAGTL